MKRLLQLALLLTATTALAQKNDAGVFAVGNLNSVNFVYIGDLARNGQPMAATNRSSVGGGAEYRHWFSDNFAWALTYEQNPSAGKLWISVANPYGDTNRWPLMHMDVAAPLTQRFHWRKWTPWLQGGPGFVLTDGPTDSGWSWNFAFVGGYGADHPLSKRWSARAGTMLLLAKTGCYNDHTCTAEWGLTEDVRLGMVWSF